MYSENRITINAPLPLIFAASANIENWPRILAHYRYVRPRRWPDGRSVFAMSAWRNFWPVNWTSTQEVIAPHQRGGPLVRYKHVKGVTRGMDVEWSFIPTDAGILVRISHDFHPGWPLLGGWPAQLVVGHLFVENIADKTLRGIKRYVERGVVKA
ncbi:MAG: hypothetical protein DLM69_07405 [Candidatus Chloroheliales bacterium]|nr:MAG: hypothetical protein DLM69_07405 [Chloroflexota bacterium]